MDEAHESAIVKILDDAAAAGPFRRLLAEAGPVRIAKSAGAGHPFAATVLARALDAPVLAITADGRGADAFAAAASTFINDEHVHVFPGWESLPYEGISPTPQIAGPAVAGCAHPATGDGRRCVRRPGRRRDPGTLADARRTRGAGAHGRRLPRTG